MKFLGTSFNLYRRLAIELLKIELFRSRRYSVAVAKANSTSGDLWVCWARLRTVFCHGLRPTRPKYNILLAKRLPQQRMEDIQLMLT